MEKLTKRRHQKRNQGKASSQYRVLLRIFVVQKVRKVNILYKVIFPSVFKKLRKLIIAIG
jgi:hypothetical protein